MTKNMISARLRLVQRDQPGAHLSKGMVVVMSDGWRGKVDQVAGDIVACIRDGERPNENWCGDYRMVGRRSMTVTGNKATCNWKGASATASPTVRRGQRSPGVVVVDLDRARREREWESAPAY